MIASAWFEDSMIAVPSTTPRHDVAAEPIHGSHRTASKLTVVSRVELAEVGTTVGFRHYIAQKLSPSMAVAVKSTPLMQSNPPVWASLRMRGRDSQWHRLLR